MELTVDTMLNVTYANVSATLYKSNMCLDTSSKHFSSNQRFE